MKSNNVREQNSRVARKSRLRKRILLILICVVMVVGIGAFGFLRRGGGSSSSNEETGLFAVKRGDLAITVTESGSIKAVKTKDIKSEVEGRATIVNIVPEGTMITQEDVNDGKVLVELDSSELKEQLSQREIELTSAEASYADANESYLIQKKQNESDVTAAELKVKFSLMDLQKYLGKVVADKLVAQATSDLGIDIPSLLDDPNALGGEASQKLRELDGAITLAEENYEKAAYELEWTEKLRAKEYVAENELREDQLTKTRSEIELDKARIALTLFKRYEFAKQAEQLLSDYQEALRELDRTEARARAQLAQAEAKLASAKSTLGTQNQRLNKLHEQIEACM
ncbi:MAG: hypothetical protein JXM79_12710, partial [Sedimentisphaerales bacterium]|nr:hypothetical protein [Sedimentisphaerales bacterium]